METASQYRGHDPRSAKTALPAIEVVHCEEWASNPFLIHGFSTRAGGFSTAYCNAARSGTALNLGFTAEDNRELVLANREELLRGLGAKHVAEQPLHLVTMQQVHSDTIHRITGVADSGAFTGDGMVTDAPGLLLAIQTADCVPVLMVDLENQCVGAFHAGWRGTLQRIVEKGVERMRREFGSRPDQLSAAIGPCIGTCCYVVGEEVRSKFAAEFDYAEKLFINNHAGAEVSLDLVEANRRQLSAAGLHGRNIHALQQCTGCMTDRYFSYRKSGGPTGRMMSVVGIR